MKKLSLAVLVSSVALVSGLGTPTFAGGLGGDMVQDAAKDAVKEKVEDAVKSKAEETLTGATGESKAEDEDKAADFEATDTNEEAAADAKQEEPLTPLTRPALP